MKNTQKQFQHAKNTLNNISESVKNKIDIVLNILPIQANELTRKYLIHKKINKHLLEKTNKTLIWFPVVILSFIALYYVDSTLLMDTYDRFTSISGKNLPNSYKQFVTFIFPLIILMFYFLGIEGYRIAKDKHLKAITANEGEIIIDGIDTTPKKPVSLYLYGILKYIFPFFVVLIWASYYLAQGNSPDFLVTSSMMWIGVVSHLLMIAFGEGALRTVKVFFAKFKQKQFWNKRVKLVTLEKETINTLSSLAESWYDKQTYYLEVFSTQPAVFLRSKYSNQEQIFLQYVSSLNFGVEPYIYKPLFPCWDDCPDDKKPQKKPDEVQGEVVPTNNTTQNNNQEETSDIETEEDFVDQNDDADFSTIIDDNEKIV